MGNRIISMIGADWSGEASTQRANLKKGDSWLKREKGFGELKFLMILDFNVENALPCTAQMPLH